MAVARDPVLEELRRSASLSASTNRKTGIGLVAADSAISLEGLEQADIDALVNRRWLLEEIIVLLRSQMAILSGGRDRRGAPIITIHGSDRSDFRPSNLAKLLSYLSKAADERLQGLGFTIILDMRQTSWSVMKKALKSLQLTFVEHVHQVLLIKPRAFWQRQKAGVSFTLKKAKFNYPIVMLESSTDLFHHLQVSQVTRDLGGTLDYNHDRWIEVQRNVEHHLIELERRLGEFDLLRDQLGHLEHLDSLNEARDAVRRHVEAKQQIDKTDLDITCDAVSHTIAKMQPCDNTDFQACFVRLEEHCSSLQVTRGQLERLWEEKGTQLDRVLQLRLFEHDSEQLSLWVLREASSLGQEHTDIGDTVSTAELRRQSFEDFRTRMKLKQQELCRVCTMGERLTAANHYAADLFRSHSKELKGTWESLVQMADDRATLLSLSVSFHEKQQKFLQKVEGWIDECMSKDFPANVGKAESLLAQHRCLKDTYQELYASARQDGHKIVERLKKPVGEGSLPTAFVIGTRHVKEILESLFDERNWLDEQWQRRNIILTQALNLRKYQSEAKKVYTWISDVGNPFLTSSNSIGSDASGAQNLLSSHDQFEGDAHGTYSLASQLFAWAKELSTSGECNPEMIEEAAESLETAVSIFATRLDERREIILHSQDYHRKTRALTEEFHRLTAPVPQDQFEGQPSDIEPRLAAFLSSWSKVRSECSKVFTCCEQLIARLNEATKSAESAGSSLNYALATESIERRLEEARSLERKVEEVCLKREKRWNLTIQLHELGPSVDKYLVELESWTQEQERVEWEPAENTMDAQLQLDAFKRQYDQLLTSHKDLVAMGRNIAKETEQLDLEMFGGPMCGHAHQLVAAMVEKLVGKMESSSAKMLAVATPKLQQLQDCLQFHLLQQRANKLTMALTTLSFSLSNLTGVGHSLDSARSLHQQASEITSQLAGVGGDVDGFSIEVEDCITRKHYQATHLSKLARSLQDKKGLVSKSATERQRLVSASVEFQQNIKNLSAAMDNCQSQFTSKEVGSTVADTERMIKNLEELKTSIEQAAEEVQSHGKKLLELVVEMAANSKTKSAAPWLSPNSVRKVQTSDAIMTLNRTPRSRRRILSSSESPAGTPKLARSITTESAAAAVVGMTNGNEETDSFVEKPISRANSLDILDSNGSDTMSVDTESTMSVKSERPGLQRLLVTPRKTGYKSSLSVPGLSPSNNDQLMIEGVLHQMEGRLEQLQELWGRRQGRLKQSLKVVEFCEAVPTVTEWVEQVGNKFFQGKHNLGRSIEEVKTLIAESRRFEEEKVTLISEKVNLLQTMYSAVEAGGSHGNLNELRAINSAMMKKWKDFQEFLKSHMANLDLSLKFQATLFEASNWCQKSQAFLNSMEEKGDVCDSSKEAGSLVAELSVFVSATKKEQLDRVSQLKELSDTLRSNRLSEVAQQIAMSSEQTVSEFDATKSNLEKLHSKLVQIEGEKDRERRLTKQRERVVEEILNTEETYVADLKIVVEKCRPRFVSNQLPPSLKGKEAIIFTNIADIEVFHRTHLLPRLQSIAGDVNGVAEVFIEHADQIAELYVPFCRDKSAADELLTSHRSYFDRIQFMFGTAVPLHSLLIKPVQRIAKYPLLMKEALKYTTELNQTSKKLEEAVKAAENILTVTNNAIHISFLEKSEELVKDLGQLLYQSPLLVSEHSRFGIKAEKERHVFAFDRALLFARKVELGQGAKFKYEHKFNVPLNGTVKIVEFIEGESCKFVLSSGDQRLHFKASSLDVKQHWVTALRTAILAETSTRSKNKTKNATMATTLTVGRPHPPQTSGIVENGWTRDLREPSPSPSFSDLNTAALGKSQFDRYQVSEDYHSSSGSEPFDLSLSKGDIVEVLDNSIDGKWYVRTIGGANHGWVPSSLLEHVPLEGSKGKEETDGKGQWVQIASGPMNSISASDDKQFHVKPNQTSFGSRDMQSQHVISTLKKVTFEDGGEVNSVAEVMVAGEEEEETSLDRPAPQGQRDRSQTLPNVLPGSSNLDVPMSPNHSVNSMGSPCTSPRGSPRASPRSSPRPSPRSSPMGQRRQNGVASQPSFSGSEKDKSPIHQNWTKSQWRRKVIRKRQSSTGRSNSVSSERSLSPSEKMLQSSSSDEAISIKVKKPAEEDASSRTLVEIEEAEAEKVRKAQLKIRYIMNELVETENQYVNQLEECITVYMSELQSSNLPEPLKGKEKLIFGNIQAIHEFHRNTFLQLVQAAKDSLEEMGKCFLDQASNFEVYVPYCENKPKSESFLWTYIHAGGNFFAEVQNRHGQRQGIDSFLIKPVQRITKYQLLLRDLKKSGEKAGLKTGNLEKALQLMQDIPKRANDAMALSMIFGYDGNIHANGQIILQDEFTVYERSRWTAARRHIFLLDQRLIITKEKDSDGMYAYKDSLKVHSLSVAEKEGDNPCRFAVGTGPIGTIDSWDQYYLLEASSPEKKKQWLDAIKDILKGQFELLKGLKVGTPGPRPRSKTFDSTSSYTLESSSAAMINISDDSENEDEEFTPTRKTSKGTSPGPWPSTPTLGTFPRRQTFGEATSQLPVIQNRSYNLYVVAEDCAPPKDNEGIMFVHKGQIYDVIDNKSDWWWARLVRDLTSQSDSICQTGWVPSSFLVKFDGFLTAEEQTNVNSIIRRKKLMKQAVNILSATSSATPNVSAVGGLGVGSPGSPRRKSAQGKSPKVEKSKLTITSSLTFQDLHSEAEQGEEPATSDRSATLPRQKAPVIVTQLSNETVIAGRTVQLKCHINKDANPPPSVEWTKDGEPLNIDRAFTNIGEEMCVLRINMVERSDEGFYTCTVSNKKGEAYSCARVTVMSPPDPPGKPIARPLTSTSVSLSWTPPTFVGRSPVTIYLVECKDTISDRWSTIMKRITEPSTIVDDLMPGAEYIFRVVAGNQIGSSDPSEESNPSQMPRSLLDTQFSLDPFHDHYSLEEAIGRGRYGNVYECVHNTTQQVYAAKLLPRDDVSSDHAHHELEMLVHVSHPNIVMLTSAFLTDRDYVLLFQLIQGVNLFEYFTHHDCLTEACASSCIEQVVSALCYLHQSNIAHLDIKPENILAVELGTSIVPEIKLIHFERSRQINSDTNLTVDRLEDHIEYEAPEILLDQSVSTVSDMWSLGVLLYTLLSGSSPFLVDSFDLTKDNIVNERYSFPVKNFREVSEEAKQLLSQLLVRDKSKRLSSLQCLRHNWLDISKQQTNEHSVKLNITRLKSYVSSRKWQSSLFLEQSRL